jgi:phage tail protein X
MSIYQGSRYEYSVVDFVSVTTEGDENPIVFYEFPDVGTLYYNEYEVKENDRIDLISYKYYRKTDLWWYILDYNPEITDPTNIPAGTVLRIPRA